MYSDTIEDALRDLSKQTRGGVALHFRSGKWSVHVDFGNIMVAVPSSVSDDPLTAIQAAISRWRLRSREYPFTYEIEARDGAQDGTSDYPVGMDTHQGKHDAGRSR